MVIEESYCIENSEKKCKHTVKSIIISIYKLLNKQKFVSNTFWNDKWQIIKVKYQY